MSTVSPYWENPGPPCAQAGDLQAAEASLAPAWIALDAGEHKLPHVGPEGQVLPPCFRRFSPTYLLVTMATAGVSVLERRREWRAAADRLQQLLGAGGGTPRGGTLKTLLEPLCHLSADVGMGVVGGRMQALLGMLVVWGGHRGMG